MPRFNRDIITTLLAFNVKRVLSRTNTKWFRFWVTSRRAKSYFIIIIFFTTLTISTWAWNFLLFTFFTECVSWRPKTFILGFALSRLQNRPCNFILSRTDLRFSIPCCLRSYSNWATLCLLIFFIVRVLAGSRCASCCLHKRPRGCSLAHTDTRFARCIRLSKVLTRTRHHIFEWSWFLIEVLFACRERPCTLHTLRFAINVVVSRARDFLGAWFGSLCWFTKGPGLRCERHSKFIFKI